jgi:mono/diheme cytochrome c family protein
MKKLIGFIGIIVVGALVAINLSSCTASEAALSQQGAQLWAQNCLRCHNAPSPKAYNDEEWDAIVNHMQKVAGFTVKDADKMSEFLQSAN